MSKNDGLTARERISKTIIQMLDACPFYAELMMRCNIREMTPDEAKVMPTMGVNIAGDLAFHPPFVDSLSDEELAFVLLHETQHKVFFHVLRGGKFQAVPWNIAADIVVDNSIMRGDWGGLKVSLPKGRIVADNHGTIELPALKLRVEDVNQKTTEQIYEEILVGLPPKLKEKFARGGSGEGENSSNKKKKGGGDDDDPLGRKIDDHDYSGSEKLSESEREEREENAKQEMVEAAFRAKRRGKLPAHIERMLKQIMEGKVDWRQYLYRYVTSEMPFDFTMSRPNRRFISQGLYVPGVVKEKLDVVVSIDLSGSIGEKEQREFLGEVAGLLRAHPNISITVLCHDSQVTSVTELNSSNNADITRVKLVGGGGTSHVPVFEWVEKNARNARVMVCLTDGYSCFPDDVPRYDVLWVISGRSNDSEFKPPFGTAVRMRSAAEI